MFGFNRPLSIDEAAEALLKLMQSDFKPEWRSRLAEVPELDPVRAEDELIFLDFFTIYFALKFTRTPAWRANGQLVFEKLFCLLAGFFAAFWAPRHAGTFDDAVRIITARIAAYGEAIEQPSSAEPDQLVEAIGLVFAAYAFAHDGIGEPWSGERAAHYDEFANKLQLDHNKVVITVAGEVFNNRLQTLYTWFDGHNVA
jgi:hypothetical protein